MQSVRKEMCLSLLVGFSPGICIVFTLEYTVYILWMEG